MTQFIMYADGGSRGNPGDAAYGAAVFEAAGHRLLAERADYIGIATNNVAEYSGLIAGLIVLADLDPHSRIEVRMDSKLVIEQMAGRWKIKHPDMRDLALRAYKIFDHKHIKWTWVPRDHNKHADALCNEALDLQAAGRDALIVRDFPL